MYKTKTDIFRNVLDDKLCIDIIHNEMQVFLLVNKTKCIIVLNACYILYFHVTFQYDLIYNFR